MSEAPVNAPPGWYGKMPSLGDFATRRLPPLFVDGWDAWLQTELVRSRAALGAAWLDAFLVAPVRRYWLAPGVLGRSAWVGVWLPSVDRVGRHFPFTVAAPVGAEVDGLRVMTRDPAWFDAVDNVACCVLDPRQGVDELERALAALPPRPVLADGVTASMPPQASTGSDANGPSSLWWCAGAHDAAHRIEVVGLPRGDAFDRLLQPCP